LDATPPEDTTPRAETEELERILALAEEGAWGEAAEQLRGQLQNAPDDPTILCWLGVAELELGMDGVAYERFRRALAAEPTDPHVLTTAGAALARLDEPGAEGALRSAALLGPEVAVARLNYGAYLTRERMFDDALVELSAALALDAEDSDTLRELGTLFSLMGRSEQAIESYEAAIRTDPHDTQSQLLLSLELLETEDHAAASAALSEAARRSSDDTDVQLVAALAAHRIELEGPAMEFIERARLVATPEEEDTVESVEDAVNRDAPDVEELLMDLARSVSRRHQAER